MYHVLNYLVKECQQLLISFWLLFGVSLAFAGQGVPFEIEADQINYQPNSDYFMASGNVIVLYEGYKMYSDRLQYQFSTSDLFLNSNIVIHDQNQNIIKANKTKLNLLNNTGVITSPNIQTKNQHYIKSQKATILANEITLDQNQYTTCNLDHPHYRLNSSKTSLLSLIHI